MRTVDELVDIVLGVDGLVGFIKEIHYLNASGLWPKYAPFLNAFMLALNLEGHPPGQCMNIAKSFGERWAIEQVAKGISYD
jgi:hypothetical protein